MNLVYILNRKDICPHCECEIENKYSYVRKMVMYKKLFINLKIYTGHEKCAYLEMVATCEYIYKKFI